MGGSWKHSNTTDVADVVMVVELGTVIIKSVATYLYHAFQKRNSTLNT